MNNKIGLGVYGTFGEPLGFQQTFYFDVSFDSSLDLDEREIEFYPGAELYAVKRELVDGRYSISFCIYSSVRELSSDRLVTFIGSCIVLENSYAEADYIYKTLRELHQNVMSNPENVEKNTLKAQQALDVLVEEPSGFVALQANVIPISKTPFVSTLVDPEKKCFVSPDVNSNDSQDSQIVAFFDEALKHFRDTGTLYFSFDQNVGAFVADADFLAMNSWEEFTNYKSQGLPPPMVLTKKGIQKFTPISTEPDEPEPESVTPSEEATTVPEPEASYEEPEEATADSITAGDTPEEDDYDTSPSESAEPEEDPYKPFDLWEEPVPEEGLSPEEARFKQREYNRLFNYTSKLLDHMNGKTSSPKSKKEKEKDRTPEPEPYIDTSVAEDEAENYDDEADRFDTQPDYYDEGNSKKKRRRKAILLLLAVIVLGALAVYFFGPSDSGSNAIPTPATMDSSDIVTDDELNEDSYYEDSQSDTTESYPEEEDEPTDSLSTEAEESSAVLPKADSTPSEVLSKQATGILKKQNKGGIAPMNPVAKAEPEKQEETPVATPVAAPVAAVPSRGVSPPDTPSGFNIMEDALPTTPLPLAEAKDLHPRPNIEIYPKDILILRTVSITGKPLTEITEMLYKNEAVKIGHIYKGQETEYMAALYYLNHKLFRRSGDRYIFTADYMQLKIPGYRSPPIPVSFPK